MIQKRKKAQFNLIDVLIVMVILGLIATAAYWIFGGFRDSRDADSAPLTFEVRISNVQEAALPLITEGLAVKDSVTGDTLGTILSVKTEKSRHFLKLANLWFLVENKLAKLLAFSFFAR